jgi:hypothetical protein
VFVCVDKEINIPKITSRLYFPFTTFAPPISSDDMKGTNSEETYKEWRCLKRHLIRTALHNGQIIVSNGGGASERALTCSYYRHDRDSKAMPVTEENPYREDALVIRKETKRPQEESRR